MLRSNSRCSVASEKFRVWLVYVTINLLEIYLELKSSGGIFR